MAEAGLKLLGGRVVFLLFFFLRENRGFCFLISDFCFLCHAWYRDRFPAEMAVLALRGAGGQDVSSQKDFSSYSLN